MLLNKKSNFIILVCTGIAFLVYIAITHYDTNKNLLDENAQSSLSYQVEKTPPQQFTNNSTTNAIGYEGSSQKSTNIAVYTEADSKDVLEWMRRNGRFSSNEMDDYKGYSENQLKSLANTGDLKALDLLTDVSLANKDINSAKNYTELGAIYGSLTSIEVLGGFVNASNPDLNAEVSHKKIIEQLGLYKVIGIRGDEYRSNAAIDSFMKVYEHTHQEKLILSQNDIDEINKKSQEIYNVWQMKRNELGLGDFENSKPLGVKRLHSILGSSK